MKNKRITRRRCLTVLASTTALPLLETGATAAPRFEWRGVALGADARMVFADSKRRAAEAALAAALAEVERLERVFSLYRKHSELSRLNASGTLAAPSQDMVILLGICRHFHEVTDGAFDPSIQPLWHALATHFSQHPYDPPPARLVDQALSLVDVRRISASAGRVELGPGMALTLNGIAQGYITDRIAELLRAAGFTRVLVQLGETRALPGKSWQIAVPGIAQTVALSDRAIATSEGLATPLSPDGAWTHLLHPRRGIAPRVFRRVSVIAPSATEADALSTALAVAKPWEAEALARRFPDARAFAVTAAGQVRHLGRG